MKPVNSSFIIHIPVQMWFIDGKQDTKYEPRIILQYTARGYESSSIVITTLIWGM